MQQLLAELIEGVILINPNGTLVWANQAALDMHGVDDIAGLGKDRQQYSARFTLRYRNNHPVEKGSYPIDRAVAGEDFSDVIVEVFPAGQEDVYWVHRARGLTLHNAQDELEYVALVLQDITDWANAEARFEKTFNANPAPALICGVGDLRFIKVNRGFLEMTGYKSDEVIGRSIYEIDVFENALHRTRAISHLCEGTTIPQTEATLRLSEGDTKHVIVAGQPLDVCDNACMLLTFTDLEPTRKAEQALTQSEERFQKAFRMSPVASAVATADEFVLIDVNQAFIKATGYSADELQGQSTRTLALWPDSECNHIRQRLKESGSLKDRDIKLQTEEGEALDCLLYAEAVVINEQDCALISLMDITERKRSEGELLQAIETVMQDTSWFSQTLLEKLSNVRRPADASTGTNLDDLTSRERDVFSLIYQGLSDKEIAKQLDIAPNTVRNYVSAIYGKLNVHSRGEAIVWARERGMRL
ncbi:helix-turn-helix transcriptional regulator [Phytohalomonas tamaricis]|uniref:helix-turn-helix transcriptional regulator n=1 Tax=Phytohalomonas tamaricis TaxID=2081032 RepID=UPI0021D4481E|nr:PAS domain S-box protein [Phytohalomonas tamaricis]